MGFLRTLSKILALLPVTLFLYDLVSEFVVHNRFKIRSFKEWWVWIFGDDGYATLSTAMTGIISSWSKFADWPAPLVLLIPPAVLYAVYRLVFALRGGRSGGGFVYKSHD